MKNLLFILLSILCLNSFGQTHTINDTTVTRYLRAKSGSKLYLMHPLVFSDASEQQSGVTNTLFSNWNSAYNLSHSHANLSLLSDIKASDTTRWASGGVTPTDNIFDWDATNNWYTFYSTSQAGKFDDSSTIPTDLTNRCNWNGSFYSSGFYSNPITNGNSGFSTVPTGSATRGVYANVANIDNPSNGKGVDAYTSTGIGIYGYANSTGTGCYGYSINGYGIRAYSSTSNAIYANSNSNTAIYASCNTNSPAITGYSANGGGANFSSISNRAGLFSQTGTPTSDITVEVFKIQRNHSTGTSYNIIGDILNLTDNPETTGIIAGSLIKGFVGSTERFRVDPRIKSHSDSTAYIFDTHRQALSTDTLLSIKNLGSNKFQVLYDGSVYSKGSIFKQGIDTLATQAYVRSHGGSGGGTWGSITGTLSSQTDLNQVLDSLRSMLPDSIPYNTDFPFNKTLTYRSHTLTANDVITINSTGAINQGGGQILFINNTSYTPNLTAYKVIGDYDNTYTYTLCTFEKVHGLYIVSIINFN
jgi:hypothetical protein